MRPSIFIAAAIACTAFAAPQVHAAAWALDLYDVAGEPATRLWGVNSSGTLVGQVSDGGYIAGAAATYVLFAPWDGVDSTVLTGISNSGLAVGIYSDPDTFEPSSFFWQDGTFTQFSLPGVLSTAVRGISPDGRYLAGVYNLNDDPGARLEGFVYDRTTGTTTTIPLPGDEAIGTVQGVNDAGQATGSFTDESFVYDLASNTEQMLATSGKLTDINLRSITDEGELGGWAVDAAGNIVGIVGTQAAGFSTLGDGPGASVYVSDITDSGLAVGLVIDAQGNDHGFIASAVTPSAVPEPASGSLLLAGVLLVGASAWRRRRVGASLR